MSLEKLKIKAEEFELSREKIDEVEKGRLSFISKFPLNSIKDLSLDQYVQGTNKDSFCYWLEFKNILFGIGGGNASKFGLYKARKNGHYYTGKGESSKDLSGEELINFFRHIKEGVVLALQYAEKNEIEKIKDIDTSLWNMVLQKILCIYFPDKFLTIGSPTVLINCAKELEIKNIELIPSNTIQINYECTKTFRNFSEYKDWAYEKLGTFIWETFNGESIKRKRNEHSSWLYAPGEGAKYWDEFYSDGIMAIGWDGLGDISLYKTKKEIVKKFQELYDTTSSKKNDALATYDFCNKMKVGDIVFVKKGISILFGYGVVSSDYYFDDSRLTYKHCLKVDWKLKGEWKVGFNLPLKTLTDVTRYDTHDEQYKNLCDNLLGIMGADASFETDDSFEAMKKLFDQSVFDNYIKYLRKIQNELSLKPNDDRVVYSVKRNRLNFTLGQRYCFNLYHSDSRGVYGVISKDKLSDNSENYNNNPDWPFYTFCPDFTPESKEWNSILEAIKEELSRTAKSGFIKHNNADFENYVFENVITEGNKMSIPLNTILYGPPGTGKTYELLEKWIPKYTSEQRSTKEKYDEAIREFVSNATWWETIVFVMVDIGGNAVSVTEIIEHPVLQMRASISRGYCLMQDCVRFCLKAFSPLAG